MKKFLFRLVTASLAVFLFWNLYLYLNPPVKSEMARHGSMEDSSVHDCLIIREEVLIPGDTGGVLESYVRENDMVKKNKAVAAVYRGDVDGATAQKLKTVNDRIAEITATASEQLSFDGDRRKVDDDIATRVADLAIAATNRNAARAADLKIELARLLDRRTSVSGEAGAASTLLADLRAEKAQYEALLSSSKQTLVSPVSGIYSSDVDGFEQVLTPGATGSMTVEDFQTVLKSEPDPAAAGAPCKIMSNIEWSAALLVEESLAARCKVGETVYLRLGEDQTESKATIRYISPQSGRKAVVIATSTHYNASAFTDRIVKAYLIKDKYSGLKLPFEAVRVKDGQTGVYTVTDGLMKFKRAEVLFQDGKEAILKEDNAVSGNLLLYDEVVVSAKTVEEGMLVR
ncbi:MAG: hypothetical protein E7409_06470 [Ruminococcaceae bacterium]|nr:hypothetical protein [Oscillospiraceae bacterium]